MSESLPPNEFAAEQPGLDLSAERRTSSESLWPLYDGLIELPDTHFAGFRFETVVAVRPLRNANYQGIVDALHGQYEQHQSQPIGPALLYRLAVLNLLANRPQRSCELIEAAIVRSTHASDKSRLLVELARVEMERLNHDGALAAYQRLAEHEPHAFPFPLEHYRLENILGAGGCSTVFLCRQAKSDTHVVVKSLDLPEHGGHTVDPLHEASLLEQLQHPGVVKLLAKGYAEPSARQRPYLVLEYLPGMTLHEYVTRCGPLSWQNWLPIARQVLATLQAVHAQRIVHRDLKPGNLLLQFESRGWMVKLIDFGIAVRQQFAAGTQGFAPPEQFDREVELGPALDVYAFGRTSCFALTGQPEIEADSFDFLPNELVNLIRECQAKSAHSRPAIPALIAAIDAILAKGWSQKKESSTREFVTPAPGPPTPKYATDIVPAEKTWIPEERDETMNPIPKHPTYKALVVESNPQDRDALAGLLAELGFEVGFARGWPTGIEAFKEAAASEQPFYFVFVSMDLHSDSALLLVEMVRDKNRSIDVIVTFDPHSSEHTKNSIIEQEFLFQPVRALAKPFELSAVREALWPKEDSAPCSAPSASIGIMPELRPTAPITTMSGPATPAPKPPDSSPEVSYPPTGEIAMWPRNRDEVLPKTLPPWAMPSEPFGPSQSIPVPPSPVPPRPSVPGVGSAHSDSPSKLQTAWELLQGKVGGWFKPKPHEEERPETGTEIVSEERLRPIERNVDHSTLEPRTTSGRVAHISPGPPAIPPAPQKDEVDCTVFAPPQIAAGETILIQAFLHLSEEAAAALELARQYDDTAVARCAHTLDTSIERGARLAIQLTLPGMEIDDATPPPIVWRGHIHGVQFGVTAPADSAARNVIGTILVILESVPIGQVKFKLTVVANSAATIRPLVTSPIPPVPAPLLQPHKMSPYQMVFISYASPDRDEVLKRVQMLKRFNVNFFQDVLSLEPGERWEQALYKHIDESDLFLLFWSTAAKNSKWVREEVNYALKLSMNNEGERPEIVPIVLEGPPVPAPHPEVAHLHFNDQILHFVADRYSSTAS